MDYLLDTNIALTYARNNQVTKKLEASLNLLSGDHRLILSVVSVGELRSITRRNNWGNKKIGQLNALINELIIVDINIEGIIEEYEKLILSVKVS